ncbi:MAG: caspase family protein [Candidatus Obscuribacterales bacterium]|nr:caspase family protein [Candidatus Obscuribacterales bacterium]
MSRLRADFGQRVQLHLQSAGDYDVESFRKHDDEICNLLDEMDANCLDIQSLSEYLNMPDSYLAQIKEEIQKSKLLLYKSSAIFNLCFGQPLQSSQCARLGLNIAELHPDTLESYISDVLFYQGAASCWAGDYKSAQEQLQRALSTGKGRSYTQLAPGQPVDLKGQNPFTPYYLTSALIADNKIAQAIDLLSSHQDSSASNEIRGHSDALLALAYALDKRSDRAKQHIELAKTELNEKSVQVFPAMAKESLGIVAALAGEYEQAELRFSEALPGLQASPLKLGNRPEAAQAALWRSYCREKLDDKVGADEDRKYAMSFANECRHLTTVAQMLDSLFGRAQTKPIVDTVHEKWAVVVGIGNFRDPSVPRLRYSKKDAVDMADFLVRQGGFKPDHVRTLLDGNATKTNLVDALAGSWLPQISRPGDLIFLFVSSHGTPAYKDIGALNSVVTYDTQLDNLFSTSVPMQSIVRMMRSKLQNRYAFAILDTCYAGGLGAPGPAAQSAANVDPDLLLSSRYQLLVSSSEAHERSWESKRYPNSIFTRQLIDGLKQHPQYGSFQSVFQDIRSRVSKEVSDDFRGNTQTPKLSGLWSGQGFVGETSLLKSASGETKSATDH